MDISAPVPSTSPTNLTKQLAARIGELIRAEGMPNGTRLAERKLAEQLRVSRTPVRSALKLLEEQGVVGAYGSGGFMVQASAAALAEVVEHTGSDEDHYRAIATDRLEGRLGDRVSERDLARRYDISRADVQRILNRIAGEGWIERLPGSGWEFMPMLTSLESYRASYRFRLTIEPAAILEDTFVLDRAGLAECRALQQKLVEGDIWTVSNAELFDINSHLHETIIECSQNSFFIEGLRRIDRIRRLIEYRQSLDRKYAIIRAREHVKLADLLLAGDRAAASDFMRLHLRSVSLEKTVPKLAGSAADVSSDVSMQVT